MVDTCIICLDELSRLEPHFNWHCDCQSIIAHPVCVARMVWASHNPSATIGASCPQCKSLWNAEDADKFLLLMHEVGINEAVTKASSTMDEQEGNRHQAQNRGSSPCPPPRPFASGVIVPWCCARCDGVPDRLLLEDKRMEHTPYMKDGIWVKNYDCFRCGQSIDEHDSLLQQPLPSCRPRCPKHASMIIIVDVHTRTRFWACSNTYMNQLVPIFDCDLTEVEPITEQSFAYGSLNRIGGVDIPPHAGAAIRRADSDISSLGSEPEIQLSLLRLDLHRMNPSSAAVSAREYTLERQRLRHARVGRNTPDGLFRNSSRFGMGSEPEL